MPLNKENFLQELQIEKPIFCGPMYPCSNPELVAAASEAGGMGFVQPVTLTYVMGYDFAEGLDYIHSLSKKPIGMNVLIENTSQKYMDRMDHWIDIALNKGVRTFITSLGKPDWVVEKVHRFGGYVLHDVTNKHWAQKAIQHNVDALICVNNRAGGHLGEHGPQELYSELSETGLPLICAGGVGDEKSFLEAMNTGYSAVQMGTRFIATRECSASIEYKKALVRLGSSHIVSSSKFTGVPISVLCKDEAVKKDLKTSKLEKWLFKHPKLKHKARLFYSILSFVGFKKSTRKDGSYKGSWQAGKSVDGIQQILSVQEVVDDLTKNWQPKANF